MAGDWIKMRSELLTHPRFLSMCNALIYDAEPPGLLLYVCGDALGLGAMPVSNESVTERALRCVTERALRDVTLCSLLRVWCAVNDHCRVDGEHALMTPMSLEDLDKIAGFEGFGLTLERVGWVRTDDKNSLIFPNFLEFNEPCCLRGPAKTNAERQAEYRRRHRGVTKSNESNGREEKRREDIKKESKPKKERARFTPPTVAQVQAYCDERNNGISGQDFVDSYERVGWVVGRNRTPMKDWKAAVRLWEQNRRKEKPGYNVTAEDDAAWTP